MRQLPVLVLGVLLLGAGFFHVWREQAEQERLERRVEALQAKVDALNGEMQEGAAPDSPVGLGAAPRAAGAAAASEPPATAEPMGARAMTAMPMGEGPVDRAAPGTQAQLLAVLESDDPVIQERMRKLIADQEVALRDQERERRQAAWEERTSSRLEELSRQVSLTPQQVDALFAILTASHDKVGESFRAARETHDFGQAEQQIEQHEKQADEEARGLLDSKQYEAYQTMRAEDADRRGWRGREPARRPASPGR
jgi:hypothetical protein